jgi:hypothetical protein
MDINKLRISTPCPVGWNQMIGDERTRFCHECRLHVYNLAELTESEAEALISSKEGRFCARLYRRADGTVLTKDCPVGLRALRRHVAKKATAAFAALVGVSASVFGQQALQKHGKESCTPQTRITRSDVKSGNAYIITGTVLDPAGGIVPYAKVSITNSETKDTHSVVVNENGRYEFSSLQEGTYTISITADGFVKHEITNLKIEQAKLLDIDTILELSGEFLVGLLDSSTLVDSKPGTTIINGDMIRRFPIQK